MALSPQPNVAAVPDFCDGALRCLSCLCVQSLQCFGAYLALLSPFLAGNCGTCYQPVSGSIPLGVSSLTFYPFFRFIIQSQMMSLSHLCMQFDYNSQCILTPSLVLPAAESLNPL